MFVVIDLSVEFYGLYAYGSHISEQTNKLPQYP